MRRPSPRPGAPRTRPIRLLLLAAALPLVLAPPALAGDGHETEAGKTESHCRTPDVDHSYDSASLSVHVKLAASGCASREHSMFYVSTAITRSDAFGPQNSVWRSVRCGPFPSRADHDGDGSWEYFCDLDVALEHPAVETNDYEIEVTFPGAVAERTLTLSLVCTSGGKSAVCDKAS